MVEWLKTWWAKLWLPGWSKGLLTYQYSVSVTENTEHVLVEEFVWTGLKWEFRQELFVPWHDLQHYPTYTPERLKR